MDLISSIKQAFTRRTYTDADMDRLMRFAKSKQGLKLTAQLMQQTDSLTKKDIGRVYAYGGLPCLPPCPNIFLCQAVGLLH